jgi:hypothetical protein
MAQWEAVVCGSWRGSDDLATAWGRLSYTSQRSSGQPWHEHLGTRRKHSPARTPGVEDQRQVRCDLRISAEPQRRRHLPPCHHVEEGIVRSDIIAHWDDDWHAPHRLRYQIETLVCERADLCGIKDLLFYDLFNQRA